MAKKQAAKKPAKQVDKASKSKPSDPSTSEPLSPQRVHELFGLPGPYEPPPPPIATKGYVTFWDCGISIQTLIKKKRDLFHLPRPTTASGARRTPTRGNGGSGKSSPASRT